MLKRSRLASVEEPSQCLQVECANTKSNVIYKKTSYNSTSSQDKTTMTDDFELGKEDKTSGAFFFCGQKNKSQHLFMTFVTFTAFPTSIPESGEEKLLKKFMTKTDQ